MMRSQIANHSTNRPISNRSISNVKDYFAGGAVIGPGAGSVVGFALGGAGASGLCFTGGGAGVPLTTDPLEPRCPIIDNASANSMNAAAKIVVAFVSRVAPERAPNAA